jgi:phosphate-selective porin OprO/OprP
VQADGRLFLNDSGANDTLLMRRVRPIVEGTVYRDFDYRVMLDFGSGASLSAANNALVQDAYVNWRIDPALQLRVGKDKEPVGLERLQSGANLLFVERAFPTQLAPNRDVGVQLRGELWQGRLEYQLGLFNGVADGGSGDFDTADSDKDFAGRVFAQPFRNSDNDWLRGFGFGVAGTYGEQDGALRNYFTTGQLRAFSYLTGTGATNSPNVLADGTHWRFTPQGWYYKGPFGLLGEFIISDQEIARTAGNRTLRANPQNTAWQVAASYFLTGEDNSFRPVQPLKPLDFGGEGWGAVELTARVSELDIDDDLFPLFANPRQSVTGITEFGFGANWHLNRFIKFSVNYHHLDFDGGEDNPATRDSEDVILGRVQFSF